MSNLLWKIYLFKCCQSFKRKLFFIIIVGSYLKTCLAFEYFLVSFRRETTCICDALTQAGLQIVLPRWRHQMPRIPFGTTPPTLPHFPPPHSVNRGRASYPMMHLDRQVTPSPQAGRQGISHPGRTTATTDEEEGHASRRTTEQEIAPPPPPPQHTHTRRNRDRGRGRGVYRGLSMGGCLVSCTHVH